MERKNLELERIHNSILKDLEKWDGKEPLEEFIAKLLEKRLLIDKEQAKRVAKQLLLGINKYKRAKKFIDKNPKVIEKLENTEKGNILKNLANTVIGIFQSVKRK